MNDQDHRRETRVVTGPEFTISFSLNGYDFREVRIMNLSVGGCFALVLGRTARFFLPGTTLDDLVLCHPDLPKHPITATVAYMLGYSASGQTEEQVGMGLQFQSLPPAAREALGAWVARATGEAEA